MLASLPGAGLPVRAGTPRTVSPMGPRALPPCAQQGLRSPSSPEGPEGRRRLSRPSLLQVVGLPTGSVLSSLRNQELRKDYVFKKFESFPRTGNAVIPK